MNYKKKILVVMPGIPFPPIDGHKLKAYNLLRILALDHTVDVVIITSEKITTDGEDFLNTVSNNYKIFTFSKIAFGLNLFRAFANRNLPFQVAYYTFGKIKKYLKSLSGAYDFVLFNLIRTTGYANCFEKHKIVLDMVDSIGMNYLRSRKNTESYIYKNIYNIEASRLVRYEKLVVSTIRLSVFVNKNEAAYYEKYGSVAWLPNGVDEKLLTIKNTDENKDNIVCFFGAMFYQPNIDASIWFINHVLPYLDPAIKFYIVGQKPAKKLLRLVKGNKRIVVTGYLDDPYKIIQSSICTVAPMQTGGGIQNKILESMALSVVTVTNNLGAAPIIGAENGKNILIANTGKEMAEIISSLRQSNDFSDVGKNARLFIKENFSWESYRTNLNALLD